MPKTPGLGEFEQLVLLAILRRHPAAHALAIREEIEAAAKRQVTRSALYTTLDRLEEKRFVSYDLEDSVPSRGGIPRRQFAVTARGLVALRRSWGAVQALGDGLDRILGHV